MNASLHHAPTALWRPLVRSVAIALVAVGCGTVAAEADAQVVYYNTMRPVIAAPVIAGTPYVANYRPTGNYATVTAYSPPVVAPASSIAVTSYYAPPVAAAPIAAPAATVAYYAPPAVPTVAAPVMATPVTAYYAPPVAAAAVAVVAPVVPVVPQLYRRGPLGVYRPVRSAYMLTY